MHTRDNLQIVSFQNILVVHGTNVKSSWNPLRLIETKLLSPPKNNTENVERWKGNYVRNVERKWNLESSINFPSRIIYYIPTYKTTIHQWVTTQIECQRLPALIRRFQSKQKKLIVARNVATSSEIPRNHTDIRLLFSIHSSNIKNSSIHLNNSFETVFLTCGLLLWKWLKWTKVSSA